ncbi:peptidylprolyl isomerase [Synechococcus sp. EJ6-Ellesmere]|uniref:peptidylprolyl isomerase n=1 Tax=Synechococcus sp. EJ6-Ellesmere TaxID=2823734 RepID=UPI0020CD7DCF|nr:peptidylprolyl isomerase [Synechococcus sp. EJ6-Ellesmere]MCP9824135.1 peptidylprolyl isomerase [Synechococcus sp. EJ6-Ellesmere]
MTLPTGGQPAPPAVTPPTLTGLAHSNLLRPYVFHQLLEETLAGGKVPDEVFVRLLTGFRQSNAIVDAAAEEAYRRRHGWSEDDLRWQVELPQRIASYAAEHFSSKAEARFLDRKTHLDQVVYSLLRVQDGALARELYLRIEEGEATFPELAEQFSEGPERGSKGLIGPTPLAQAHPTLVQRLRSSKPGTLLAPFQVEQWWLVVRLEKLQPASLDEATRQRMAQELFDEWLQEETTYRIASLCPAPLAQGV